MIRVGVIGYGNWGPNLARCAAAHADYRLTSICDLSAERLRAAAHVHSAARLEPDWRVVVADADIDALFVATPATTHFQLAHAALCADKHVMVEKPIARTSRDIAALIEAAERRELVLMTDHTYVFSSAVGAIRELLAAGAVGTVHALDSVRTNGNGTRCEVDVLYDLATHDLAILDHLFGVPPRSVRANGLDSGYGASLTLVYPAGLVADVKVSWKGGARTRRMQISGSKGTLTFDDLAPVRKLAVRAAAGGSDVFHPPLEQIEPLRGVIAHFADCILRGERPMCDGAAGLRVVGLLEAAGRSLASGGREIFMNADEVVIA